MPREHGKDGTYVETVAPDDVLDVFDTVDGPVVFSADVADELECSRETARQKLQDLYDRGNLDRRKVSRRVVYWRATGFDTEELRGDPETTLNDTGDVDARDAGGSDTREAPRGETNAESGRTRDENTGGLNLGALSFDRDLTLARREQLEEWLQHAADNDDGVSKSDFDEWWTDERGSKTGYNSGSFWEAFAKAAMKQSDRFSKPNMRTYRYVGDESSPDEGPSEIYDPTDEF